MKEGNSLLLDWRPLAFHTRPGAVSWCWLAVVQIAGRVIAVFAEDQGYHGPSITNNVEQAIASYHRLADLYDWPEPSHLEYAETYLDEIGDFDLVKLTLDPQDVSWEAVPEQIAWEICRLTRLISDDPITLK
jgi:hypothetical protein